jgi:hypothetical protein
VALSAEPLDAVALDPGSNVLVTGPPMTGKRRLLLRLLAAGGSGDAPGAGGRPDGGTRGKVETGAGDGREDDPDTVLVTTRRSAPAVAREFEAVGGRRDGLSIVDCVSRVGGLDRPTRRTADRRYASDPGDLTGIGIGVTEFVRRRYEGDRAARVGVHSLSTMLMYADLRRLFQFLHVVTGRIAACGFVGAFVADGGVLDDRELAILRQPFDALVELRESTGRSGRELRVRREDGGGIGWTPL